MSIDALLKSLAMFKEGMRDYATLRATNDARQQLALLEQQQLDRSQLLNAQTAIGQDLALRLAGIGTDPAQAQIAVSQLAPSAGARFQADVNADLQSASHQFQEEHQRRQFDFQAEQNQLDRELAREKLQAQLLSQKANADRKLTNAEVSFIERNQKAFELAARDSLKALNQIRVAEEALKSNNPIADASLVNFLARASGEVGALTEADKKPFGGSRAFAEQANQFISNARSGRFTTQNRIFVKKLLDVYKKAQTNNIITARDRIAKRASKTAEIAGFPLTEQDLKQLIHTEIDITDTQAPSASLQPAPSPQSAPPPAQQGLDLRKYLIRRGN